MKILIGTKNPGKVESAQKAFEHYYNNFEIIPIDVKSDVADEPVNSDIYLGAKNRIKNLKEYAEKNNIDADFFVAVESGITNLLGEWMITCIAAMEDKNGITSCGTGPSYPVPDKYVDEIIEKDLQVLMDRLFDTTNIGQSNGGIGKISHDIISRKNLNELAFIMCLTKYINGDKWQ